MLFKPLLIAEYFFTVGTTHRNPSSHMPVQVLLVGERLFIDRTGVLLVRGNDMTPPKFHIAEHFFTKVASNHTRSSLV